MYKILNIAFKYSRCSSVRVPLKYPKLDTSAYISHKTLPSEPEPQSAVPQDFLDQIHVKRDQKGGGADPQVEEALQNPVKVSYSHVFIVRLTKIGVSGFQVSEIEIDDLIATGSAEEKESSQNFNALEPRALPETNAAESDPSPTDPQPIQATSDPVASPSPKKRKRAARGDNSTSGLRII